MPWMNEEKPRHLLSLQVSSSMLISFDSHNSLMRQSDSHFADEEINGGSIVWQFA